MRNGSVMNVLAALNFSVGGAAVIVGALSRDFTLGALGLVSLSLAALFLGVFDDD